MTTTTRKSQSMTMADAADLIRFAQIWAPYGGGSTEEIYVTFGLAPHAYFTRLRDALKSPAIRGLAAGDVARLRSICLCRLT